MNLIASFQNTDAFFPILIGMLAIIIFIFVYVIYSGRKQEKILKEKKMRILESAEKMELDSDNFDSDTPILKDDSAYHNEDNSNDDDLEEKTQVFDFDLEDSEEKTVTFDPVVIYEENESASEDENVEMPSLNKDVIEESNESESLMKDEEPTYQYTSEKTEIFDFPDFSDIMDSDIANAKVSDLKENIAGVSEEVMREANKFIEEIMHDEEN